jgi:proteic killer suppression protein
MPMIKSFADKHTRDIFLTGKSKKFHPELARKAVRRLEYVDLAISLSDLRVPLSNRLHALRGDRKGQYSISINDQWRICFRFENDNAYDVEITDYH